MQALHVSKQKQDLETENNDKSMTDEKLKSGLSSTDSMEIKDQEEIETEKKS